MTRVWTEREENRRYLDEEPLESDGPEDEVDRCWGYENPVRHRIRSPHPESMP